MATPNGTGEGRQDQRRECGPAGQGAPLRVPTRAPWRVESPARWRPGATTAAPARTTVLAVPAGLLDDLPFLPTGTGPARCGRLQAPRGCTCGYRRTVRSSHRSS
jgi:hypothetical protein